MGEITTPSGSDRQSYSSRWRRSLSCWRSSSMSHRPCPPAVTTAGVTSPCCHQRTRVPRSTPSSRAATPVATSAATFKTITYECRVYYRAATFATNKNVCNDWPLWRPQLDFGPEPFVEICRQRKLVQKGPGIGLLHECQKRHVHELGFVRLQDARCRIVQSMDQPAPIKNQLGDRRKLPLWRPSR
jgi:hypothetical protein